MSTVPGITANELMSKPNFLPDLDRFLNAGLYRLVVILTSNEVLVYPSEADEKASNLKSELQGRGIIAKILQDKPVLVMEKVDLSWTRKKIMPIVKETLNLS